MSVLIKDMGKPKSCYAVIDGESEYCPFVNTDDDCVLLLKKGMCTETWEDQYSKCPLVEVQYPCEDAVSRKATIDALNAYEDVVDTASQVFTIRGCKKAITNLPSVQPEPCEDAVSRADIEAEIANILKRVFVEYQDIAKKTVAKLPSVTPKRKTGKWIIDGHHIVCSECETVMCNTDREGDSFPTNFCPNCGAEMEKMEGSE